MRCPIHGVDHDEAGEPDWRLDVALRALDSAQEQLAAQGEAMRHMMTSVVGAGGEAAQGREHIQRLVTVLGGLPDDERVNVGAVRKAMGLILDDGATVQAEARTYAKGDPKPDCTCDSPAPEQFHTGLCEVVRWALAQQMSD